MSVIIKSRAQVLMKTRPLFRQALNFSFKSLYTPILRVREDAPHALLFASNVATGSIAGASSLAFVYSLDLARTRLASDSKDEKTGARQFKNMRAVYKHVFLHDGLRGLYTGFLPGSVSLSLSLCAEASTKRKVKLT